MKNLTLGELEQSEWYDTEGLMPHEDTYPAPELDVLILGNDIVHADTGEILDDPAWFDGTKVRIVAFDLDSMVTALLAGLLDDKLQSVVGRIVLNVHAAFAH